MRLQWLAVLSQGDLPDALDVLPLAARPREEVQGVRAASPLHLRLGWQPPTGRPISVRLADQPLGLQVTAEWTGALARWLVVQSAVLHDPAELGILTALSRSDADRWAWTDRLPHATAGERESAARADAERTLRELSDLVDQQRAEGDGSWSRRLLVVVEQDELVRAKGVAERGVVEGVNVIAIGGRPQGAVQAEIDGRRGTLLLRRGDELTVGHPDGLAAGAALQVVAALTG